MQFSALYFSVLRVIFKCWEILFIKYSRLFNFDLPQLLSLLCIYSYYRAQSCNVKHRICTLQYCFTASFICLHCCYWPLALSSTTMSVVIRTQTWEFLFAFCLYKLLQAGRFGDRIRVAARFSAPVETGARAHPAFCTMVRGSVARGVKRQERGVDYPPQVAPRLKKE